MKCACCFTDNPEDAQSCAACGQASWLDLPATPKAAPEASADESAQTGLAFTRKKGGR